MVQYVYGSHVASNPLALAFEVFGTLPMLCLCAVFFGAIVTVAIMGLTSLAPASPRPSYRRAKRPLVSSFAKGR